MKQTYTHPALPRFAELAERFCKLVQMKAVSPSDQLRELHDLLPRLYVAALDLPSTSVLFEDDSDNDEDDDRPVDGQRIHTRAPLTPLPTDALAEFLGLRRYYREVFDPYATPDDSEVTGDLLDDIADIFGDLNRGLEAWSAGQTGVALWEWRFAFESHWGEHVTSAIRALFAMCAWHDAEWPTGAA